MAKRKTPPLRRPGFHKYDISQIRNEDLDRYMIQTLLKDGWTIYDLPLRVACYSRVSTDEEMQLHSLNAQVKYFREYVNNAPNWTLVGTYFDEGITGTSTKKRESFNRMILDAEERKFNLILTKEVSRFARNLLDSIAYTRKLLEKGIAVYFLSDGIMTFNEDSELRLGIMASVAQEESRKTSSRVKFGFRRSIENGSVLGSNRIYGYDKDNGRLVINEKEAEMVRKAFDLYVNHGLGIRRVGVELTNQGYRNFAGGPITSATVKNILRNPKYKGYYCGGKTEKVNFLSSEIKQIPRDEWVMYKDETGEIVPALVDEEIWDKAQKILDSKTAQYMSLNPNGTKPRASYKGMYPYSSKIICEEHNTTFVRRLYKYTKKDGTKVEREIWRCLYQVQSGNHFCSMPKLYSSDLDEIMTQVLDYVIKDKEAILKRAEEIYKAILNEPRAFEKEIAAQEKKIKSIEAKKDKLLDLVVHGRISDAEFQKRNDSLNVELSEAMDEKKRLVDEQTKANSNSMPTPERIREDIEYIVQFKEGFSPGLVDKVLDHIVIQKGSTNEKINLLIYLHGNPNPYKGQIGGNTGGDGTAQNPGNGCGSGDIVFSAKCYQPEDCPVEHKENQCRRCTRSWTGWRRSCRSSASRTGWRRGGR